MNRKARRDKKKSEKKETNKKIEALAWFRSLPQTKQALIESLVKIEAKKDNENLIQAIDRCFTAALIQELEDLSLKEVERILEASTELMIEDADKMKELKNTFGGNYNMARKAVNDLGPMVEERAREYIKEGCNQKVSVKLLQEEFPTLSIAMITNAFKKVKAMVKEEKTLEAVKEAVKLEEVKNEVEYDEEIEAMAEYILEEEVKESIVEEKEVAPTSKFKVVKEITKVVEREVQGEYGLYNIKGSVITVNEEFAFSNENDVKSWASENREELLKQIEEIKTKINNINNRENEAIEVIKTFM